MTKLKHDPEDRETCSFCGIAEDIHLLDGVLDANGQDTGKISCIRCYPVQDSWCPTGVEHISISIAPDLKPLYAAWLRRDAATRAEMDIHLKMLDLQNMGFICGDRDPRINTRFAGKFMVAQRYEQSELPTKDGMNGPWCIVGDDLNVLIKEAHEVWCE